MTNRWTYEDEVMLANLMQRKHDFRVAVREPLIDLVRDNLPIGNDCSNGEIADALIENAARFIEALQPFVLVNDKE